MWRYESPAADMAWLMHAADDLLSGNGHALLPWAGLRIALTASAPGRPPPPGTPPAASWLDLARFGLQWLPPRAQVRWTRARQCDAALPLTA
jgi:hypothetical protein